MTPSSAATPQTDAHATITYESFLLRLRRVMGSAGERRQIWLITVPDHEECYFNSLRELMAYLQQRNGAREEGSSPFATGEG